MPATPYLGQLSIVSFGFAPKGWALCNGQTLPINQNQALFSLLGTTYGGNGTTNFNLPNLQGQVPIHQGPGFVLGAASGEASHTLTLDEIPSHTHSLVASSDAATLPEPTLALMAEPPIGMGNVYAPETGQDAAMASNAIITSGNAGQPHENRQPYLVVNVIIALEGIFPSRN